MDIEADLLIAILKLTGEGSVSHELIKREAKLPSETLQGLLQKLQNDGLVNLRGTLVMANTLQRLRLAVCALGLGIDPERVSNYLHWREFEGIAAIALERNGYSITRNLRFAHAGRKWEIDIVGCRRPIVVCIDCKHWHHGMSPAKLKEITGEQVRRTDALAKAQPNPTLKAEFVLWNEARFIPTIVSFVNTGFKYCDAVPIVPILQLEDFLDHLPAHTNSMLTRTAHSRPDLQYWLFRKSQGGK